MWGPRPRRQHLGGSAVAASLPFFAIVFISCRNSRSVAANEAHAEPGLHRMSWSGTRGRLVQHPLGFIVLGRVQAERHVAAVEAQISLDKPTCRTRCQTPSDNTERRGNWRMRAHVATCVTKPSNGLHGDGAERARTRLRARIKAAQERQDRELSETLAGANENAREQRRDNQDSFGECGGSESLGGQRTKRSQTRTKVSPR